MQRSAPKPVLMGRIERVLNPIGNYQFDNWLQVSVHIDHTLLSKCSNQNSND